MLFQVFIVGVLGFNKIWCKYTKYFPEWANNISFFSYDYSENIMTRSRIRCHTLFSKCHRGEWHLRYHTQGVLAPLRYASVSFVAERPWAISRFLLCMRPFGPSGPFGAHFRNFNNYTIFFICASKKLQKSSAIQKISVILSSVNISGIL